MKLSGKCLDLKKLMKKAVNTENSEKMNHEAEYFNKETSVKLSKLMTMAGYKETKQGEILKKYSILKTGLLEIVMDDQNELVKRFSHVLNLAN